jgi:glycosyltransferase involved in cell wall biosynthesis
MKIVVVAPSQIPARRANTLQVMKMTHAMCQVGHQVRLVVPFESSHHTGKVKTIAKWEDLSQHYGLQEEFPIDWLLTSRSLRRYDFGLKSVFWARQWGAEVLYTRLPQAAALSSFMGMPTILEVHDLPQGYLGPWMFHCFLKGKGARRLVAITQALAQDLLIKLDAPPLNHFTVVAPDGVDLIRYINFPDPPQARMSLTLTSVDGHAGSPLSIAPERFTVGYTGHLYLGRGIEILLALATRLPEMTFLIVGGEPPDVSRLQVEVVSQRLENVLLTGYVPNSELPRYQAACDVLLMPYQHRVAASSGGDISNYLSPMKLFEYMACQRAIISSDLPVLHEILNHQNAMLMPIDDIGAWVNALRRLKNDVELRNRLATQSRRDAELYTWETRAIKIFGEP